MIAQINMEKQQLETCGIRTESIANLLSVVSRRDFIPEKFNDFCFSDFRIPLSHEQAMMTPLEEATIMQSLDVQKHHTVLEVGTGSGYLTALLAKQAKHVFSIEYYEDLSLNAKKKLANHDIDNVTLITGDGSHGYMDKAPFDRIVITASMEHLDKSFHPQLLQDGKLIAVVGHAPAMKACLFTLDSRGQWSSQILFETNAAPLINRHQKNTFSF